ncbi:MAG TPA: hypothetical protein VK480_02820, partial [Solirubrobacterales bacterium]|nr:hypothetical protein [Solirubrobacterales bacterium]
PAVIVVDNLADPDVSFDLFGRLRDELWAAGHVWLVAARPKDSSAFRAPPAEAFWGAVVEIPPLNEHEVLEFLHKGLSNDEIAQLRKLPLAGFHPRLLIRELHSALEEDPQAKAKEARIGGLLRRAAELGRSEELALRELIGLGRPASAHDPDLLANLGWSRSYAQRIFSHLESNRLVRSLPEATGERAGRPRKLYEPSPSAPA